MKTTVIAIVPDYFDELKVYSECGMSNSDVLKFATVVASELLRIKGRTGIIEKGKKADMIIVEGDPLKRLSDLRSLDVFLKRDIGILRMKC